MFASCHLENEKVFRGSFRLCMKKRLFFPQCYTVARNKVREGLLDVHYIDQCSCLLIITIQLASFKGWPSTTVLPNHTPHSPRTKQPWLVISEARGLPCGERWTGQRRMPLHWPTLSEQATLWLESWCQASPRTDQRSRVRVSGLKPPLFVSEEIGWLLNNPHTL